MIPRREHKRVEKKLSITNSTEIERYASNTYWLTKGLVAVHSEQVTAQPILIIHVHPTNSWAFLYEINWHVQFHFN